VRRERVPIKWNHLIDKDAAQNQSVMSEAKKASNFFNDKLYDGHRQLPSLGHRCDVVVRSQIATKAGDRGEPNRRDSTMLARLIGPGR
jgi:hypothetical protein